MSATWLLVALWLTACATTPRPKAAPTKRPQAAATATQPGVQTDPPLAPLAPNAAASSPASTSTLTSVPTARRGAEHCLGIVAHFAPIYKSLFLQLPKGTYAKSGTPAEELSFAQASQCQQPASRAALLTAAVAAVQGHSGRIGIILPLTGPRAKQATFLVNGMRAAVNEQAGDSKAFEQRFVLKDSAGGTALSRLAELVFKDRVAMVVGGFERETAALLVTWSGRLLLPVLILNRERELTAAARYAFTVYPGEDHLANTLAKASRERGYKRIAILRPSSGRGDKVAAYFTKAFTAAGGQIGNDLTYTSGHFESMQDAAKKLLKTGTRDREDEYRAVYKKAREDAEAAGTAFNPKMVLLKPLIDVDAVFIPDDFRSVRYFAKIFKYHQVAQLPMLGHHEWRSPALVEPYDDFLTGSMFADFIGDYTKLPVGVSAPPLRSTALFVEPKHVEMVDFQLMGYRAARVALAATANLQIQRRQLPAKLMALTGAQTGLPVTGPIFAADHLCFWPTYIFHISKQGLQLEAPAPNSLRGATSP